MNSCGNCKHAYPFNYGDDAKWSEEDQRLLDEERKRNEEIRKEYEKNKKSWFFTARSPSFDYDRMYSRYLFYKELQEKTIECRWSPNFAERLKTDKCAQWEEK